jgi:hypothetical protein
MAVFYVLINQGFRFIKTGKLDIESGPLKDDFLFFLSRGEKMSGEVTFLILQNVF